MIKQSLAKFVGGGGGGEGYYGWLAAQDALGHSASSIRLAGPAKWTVH